MFVVPICVFTNQNVKLRLNNATTNILKLKELIDFILRYESKIFLSDIELQKIGQSIIEETLRS